VIDVQGEGATEFLSTDTKFDAPWNAQVLVADDIGGAIQGRYVNVYCGDGPQAHQEPLRITEDNRRVCLG